MINLILGDAAAKTAIHLPPMIVDLGLILITAAIATLIFKKLKQPLVLGYLIAGFFAGANFKYFPTIQDHESVQLWAEIGVLFLIFSLGIEFSFKKLMKVGGSASITASTQIVVMCLLGFFFGQLMGWSNIDSIFLGGILSISSTTIILKSFEELGVKAQKFAHTVFGALIVQDIIAVLLLVLLSTIAVSNQFSGGELLQSILRLIFFLVLWFVGGIFIVPSIFRKIKPLLTDEMLLIISLSLCFLMAILAAHVEFSPALGAFIMGSIIAETKEAEHIERLVKPVKDLFGAIFFVSVGMLIDTNILYEHLVPVMLLSVLVIVGQSVSSTGGALLSGLSLKDSVRTGMSLSQIGEFSFIIATLGMTLKVTSSFLYPIVVAVSAVTVFTTPFMVKFSLPFSEYLTAKLPRKWIKSIERYSANAQAIKTVGLWQTIIKAYIAQVFIFTVIIISIIILSSKFLLPLVQEYYLGNVLAAFVTLIIVFPFLWALASRRIAVSEVSKLIEERKSRRPLGMLFLVRTILSLLLVGFLLNIFFSPKIAVICFGISLLLYKLFHTKIINQYHAIERHFMANFNDRESSKMQRSMSDLTPWDGHIAMFSVPQSSNLAGKSLKNLQLREKLGVNIASIKRGDFSIHIPVAGERIFPGDEICVIGTDVQLQMFEKYIEEHDVDVVPDKISEIVLRQIILKNPTFLGKSIKDSSLREKTKGLVVGIERRGIRTFNPESDTILIKDDILWIVGDKKLLAELSKN